mgnify:CR=1 FL=1
MITSIVFSKDRPLQLDLALNSIKQNFKLCQNIIVIYKNSQPEYEESYENLKKEHPDVNFWQQSSSIFTDILTAVKESFDYLCFFTDDNIVYQNVDIHKGILDQVFSLPNQEGKIVGCSCISLRLGMNTKKRDYSDGSSSLGLQDDILPKVVLLDPFLVIGWAFTSIAPGGYWSYPLSVDGHIFSKKAILSFCTELDFLNSHYDKLHNESGEDWRWNQTPNEFEAKLQRFYFDLPNAMICLQYSCVVNSPNNRVQNHINNKNGDSFPCDPLELNNLYKLGKRLNLSKIDFGEIVVPHQEIDILKGLE